MFGLKCKWLGGDGTKDEGRREKTEGRGRDINNQVSLSGGLETHNAARPWGMGMGIHDPAFKIKFKQGKKDSKPKLLFLGFLSFRYTQTTGSLLKVDSEH